MDLNNVEINEFLNQKRKSKRRSSIATNDATKILNNQKDIESRNDNAKMEQLYEIIDNDCNLQSEWLDKNYNILETYSNELVNRVNSSRDKLSNIEILNEAQREFLKKYSLNLDFFDKFVRKVEALTIKSEAINAILRVKKFENSRKQEANNLRKYSLTCSSMVKKPVHGDPIQLLHEYFNS